MDIENLVKSEPAVLLYFSTQNCSVCKTLQPSVKSLIENKFPKIKFYSISLNDNPLVSAQLNIFSAPTIILFFEGKEYIRKSNNISISKFEKDIDRLYSVLFE